MLALWLLALSSVLQQGAAQTLSIPTSSKQPLRVGGGAEPRRAMRRQLSGLPSCVLDCLSSGATAAGCSSYTDVTCVCPSSTFQTTALACLQQSCSAANVDIAVSVADAICGTVDDALTILNDITADPAAVSRTRSVLSTRSVASVSSASALSASSTRSVSSAASAAAVSASSDAVLSSHSLASATSAASAASDASTASAASISSISAASLSSVSAADTTATQPIDVQSTSSSSTLSAAKVGGIVGGVLGGLLLLILLGLLIFCLCRRRTRARNGSVIDLDWDSSFDPYAHEHRGISDSLLESEPVSGADAIAAAPWLAQGSSRGSGTHPTTGRRPLQAPIGVRDTEAPEMRVRPHSSSPLVSPYNVTPFTPPTSGSFAAGGAGLADSPSMGSIYHTRRASSMFDRSSGGEADAEPLSPDSAGSDTHVPPSAMFLHGSPSANGAAIHRTPSAAQPSGAAAVGLRRNPSVAAQVKAREAFSRFHAPGQESLERRQSTGSVLQHTDGGPLSAEEMDEQPEGMQEIPPRYDMIPDQSKGRFV
ncbi:hypothetical protein CALVIDRAFT_86289 [Calocera viscosa TUFC12733]|uniref:receptor protein-tyrosine kinase n=1 Tax=Calocera viscosa (strain TUFC12733) TaxID=1330018 RepID=A0A167N568_CALVF|nr:hypothetical protein CALVIDRAFT_86289 [Calocera viscosa TUFC12733]